MYLAFFSGLTATVTDVLTVVMATDTMTDMAMTDTDMTDIMMDTDVVVDSEDSEDSEEEDSDVIKCGELLLRFRT